eukprot:TRINITY_DN11962_c0_g1_i1.p1 TRINITY_DN11962_c0_g1~~TRINITY_DN11962_c0_g1_i1.p1  ORF type:complete len:399 (-),score=89.00 TRINITY_DN11962_c0_g1_i1:7-1203(-)
MEPLKKLTEIACAVNGGVRDITTNSVSWRFGGTSAQSFSDKVKERRRRYYLKNKETIAELQRQYRARHKEAIKIRKKQYTLKNKPSISLRQRLYYLANKEAKRQYYLNNKQIKKSRSVQPKPALSAQKKQSPQDKELKRQRQRKYYHKNKEAKKDYYHKMKENVKVVQRQYYLKNKEVIKMKKKQYYITNLEAIREKHRQYRLKHHHAIREWYLKSKKPRKSKIWTDPISVRQFFEYASGQLHVGDPLDWYRISRPQIRKVGGLSLYSIFGNLGKALQFAFPTLQWDISKFSFRGKKATQRWLKVLLGQILPKNTYILEDYSHPELFWDETQKPRHLMELDIWVPEYQIALEYQGEHHYHDLYVYGPSGTLSQYTQRDIKKKEACLKKGITLVTIPYW